MTRDEYIKILRKTYSLISVLSRKNGGEVLRLRHKEQGKDIVVRSFPTPIPAYEKLYALQCLHLPLIYDVITLEDGQIVLEEFIDGITVAQVLESGKYRYLGAKRVIVGVCRGLSVLHELELVHRDVKPENVMIDRDGRVVLIDFNASRRVSVNQKDTVIMGTVGYISPEQLVAQSDERTDVYAVGVLLNVMVTGQYPSEKIAKGKAGRIVRKCTKVNPDERYQTAEKLIKAL